LLATLFQREGRAVRLAANGALALESARQCPPDLILLDIMMPDMDGYEVARRLKAETGLGSVPIIFVSGRTEVGDKLRAFQQGGVDFVTKPFHLEEVEARVETHLALRRQARELRESYRALKELEAARDGLFHMIVHDMPAPLMALSTALTLIEQDLPSGSVRAGQGVAFAQRAANELGAMAGELLDVSRLETGRMPLARGRRDLERTTREAMELIAPLAQNRPVKLLGPPAVEAVYDEDLVRRVVANLLCNAYKSTPDGSEVVVEVGREDDRARVTVKDCGPGIPPGFQSAIFQKFRPSDPGRKALGSGLGLAFCRLAVEAQGGSIQVVSEAGKGSSFSFTLPAEDAAAG
jgi:signal transduction histidine kinase